MSEDTSRPVKRRRRLWIVLGLVAAFLALAALALPLLVDAERFRGRIERALEDSTGWRAELGTIDLGIVGGLSLDVRPARLAALDGTSTISIEALSVDASLLPLFRGELDVSSIELVEPAIELVRESAEEGWRLPSPGGQGEADRPGGADSSGDRAPRASKRAGAPVSIERVLITRGRARLVDRSGAEEKRLGLEGLDLLLRPDAMTLEGSARLEGDDGRLELGASPEKGWQIDLREVGSGALGFFVDEALLRPGGRLSGSLRAASLERVEADLRGEQLPLLAGERPLESMEARLVLVSAPGSWSVEDMRVSAGALVLSGGGTITPRVELDLAVGRADLDPALETLRALFPLPLDLSGPGWLEAQVRLRGREGGLVYSAQGALEAARMVAGGPLPPVEEIAARFRLDEAGTLRVDIDEARAAEGPLRGQARLTPVYPPGVLTFDGRLDEASMGGLLAGLLGEKARAIRGPTSLTTALRMDLSKSELGPAALGGRLSLRSVDVRLPGWDLEGALYRKLDEKLEGLGALRGLLEGRVGGGASLERETSPEGDERLLDLLGSDVVFSGPPWTLEGVAVSSGDLLAEGGGSFDPATGAVALELTARLDQGATAELIAKEKALKALVARDGRLTLPLSLEGPLTSPRIRIEIGDLLRGEGAQDALEGLVEGLFKKRDKDKK